MSWFLAKSEPQVYSIDQLEKDGKTLWDGVVNPQAVAAIKKMKPGDRVFFYHSGGESAIVGIGEVLTEGREDPKNPKSAVIDMGFGAKLETPTGLREIKETHLFDDFALVRQSRLSTMEVPEKFVAWMKKRYPKAGI
jgi:predicted RNA-binding protein with PUA-like domain